MADLQQCKLCLQPSKLCKSHAIPDEFFKTLKRKNSGNVILLTGNSEKIRQTQNSGAEPQLCQRCETYLNDLCDRKSIEFIKRSAQLFLADVDAARIEVDSNAIRKFAISVLWRASTSSAEGYREFNLGHDRNEKIRKHLIGSNEDLKYSVRVSRLADSTNNGFSQESVDEFIATPFCIENSNAVIVLGFIVMGFWFEVYIGNLPKIARSKIGFIKKRSNSTSIQTEEILSKKDLVLMLGKNILKHESGHSTLKL